MTAVGPPGQGDRRPAGERRRRPLPGPLDAAVRTGGPLAVAARGLGRIERREHGDGPLHRSGSHQLEAAQRDRRGPRPLDDQTAITVIDGAVDVVSRGTGGCSPADGLAGARRRKYREIPGMSAISSIEVTSDRQFEHGDSHDCGARGRTDTGPRNRRPLRARPLKKPGRSARGRRPGPSSPTAARSTMPSRRSSPRRESPARSPAGRTRRCATGSSPTRLTRCRSTGSGTWPAGRSRSPRSWTRGWRPSARSSRPGRTGSGGSRVSAAGRPGGSWPPRRR